MQLKDLRHSDVVMVNPETTIVGIAWLLVEHNISGLPVVDEGGISWVS